MPISWSPRTMRCSAIRRPREPASADGGRPARRGAGARAGRGCLGRPWLFRDLADALAGRPLQAQPTFGEVADIMVEHAHMLVEWFDNERMSMVAFRKHAGWYTRGFRNTAPLRERHHHHPPG